MSKIVQIGSGMIGTTMAYDLSQEHDIIVGDFDDSSFAKLERLNPNIVAKKIDVTNSLELKEFIHSIQILIS